MDEDFDPLDILDRLEAEVARRSLAAFIKKTWTLIEPKQALSWNWHHDLLCTELEAVTAGKTSRLLINIPPGTSKSLFVNVFWPAWEWATEPSTSYISASYGGHLATRDNMRMRNLIMSPWYQQHYSVALSDDQSAKTWFINTDGGWRLGTSVGGVATGEHPSRIIIDDPHSAKQARSDLERQAALDWYDSTISTRGATKDTKHVVIMQRLHEDDLTGHLIARGGFRHVMLPMRFDPSRKTEGDPRTVAGELLWPAIFTEEKVRQLELDLGPYDAAGQLQQAPAPPGGGLFKEEWFGIVDAAPANAVRCRAWDVAGTEGAGCFTAGVKIARSPEGVYYIEDVRRGQWSPATVDAMIERCAQTDGITTRIREEQEPGSAGASVIAARARRLARYDYGPSKPSGDKVVRARPYRAQCEAGNVKLVRGTWNREFVQEHAVFPNGKFLDQVDAAAHAFNELAGGAASLRVIRGEWG